MVHRDISYKHKVYYVTLGLEYGPHGLDYLQGQYYKNMEYIYGTSGPYHSHHGKYHSTGPISCTTLGYIMVHRTLHDGLQQLYYTNLR